MGSDIETLSNETRQPLRFQSVERERTAITPRYCEGESSLTGWIADTMNLKI
jgi:hypothetical protein